MQAIITKMVIYNKLHMNSRPVSTLSCQLIKFFTLTFGQRFCIAFIHDVMNFSSLQNDLQELYKFRDIFFENHPIELASEKNKMVEEKKNILVEKFESIDGKYYLKRYIYKIFYPHRHYNLLICIFMIHISDC